MSHKKKQSFWSTLERLFEPALVHKKIYGLFILCVGTWPFYGIITTLLFSKAVWYIQNPEKERFFMMVIIYAIFVLVYQVWNLVLSFYTQRFMWLSFQYLYPLYFTKYVKLDWNETDMIGTWKMISIIEKWTDQQVELVMESWRLWVWALINIAFVL